jgi:DNA-binding Lrp family transcriptional regulator
MVTAIVLVHAERTRIPETAEALAAVSFVSEVYSVTGDWDIVAVLRLPRYEDLAGVVTDELRHVPGIERTSTMLAFRTHSPALLDRAFGIGLEEGEGERTGEAGV